MQAQSCDIMSHVLFAHKFVTHAIYYRFCFKITYTGLYSYIKLLLFIRHAHAKYILYKCCT